MKKSKVLVDLMDMQYSLEKLVEENKDFPWSVRNELRYQIDKLDEIVYGMRSEWGE